MIRVIHIIDEEAPEDAARILSGLLRYLPDDRLGHEVIVIGRMPSGLEVPQQIPVHHVARRVGQMAFGVRLLRRVLEQSGRRHGPGVVHAWSALAARSASVTTRTGDTMVTTLVDPAETWVPLDWWPTPGSRPGRVNIICTSGLIRDRLVQAGVTLDMLSVIPPTMDENCALSSLSELRNRLGLSVDALVLLTAAPPSRAGGQFDAVWAAAILRQLWPNVRMIVPGYSSEQRRIERLVDSIYCPEVYRFVGDDHRPAELLAVSDALLFPAVGEVSVGWLIAAMIARVPVIACDVPCVTEWITDGRTGFLCAPHQPRALAVRTRAALESGSALHRCAETAHTVAARNACLETCAQAYLRVYESAAPNRLAATQTA